MARDAMKKTCGSAGLSDLDADAGCRTLMLGNFGTWEEDLRKAIADMTKGLCQDNNIQHLETFSACELSLDKLPGVRPSGIVEVLRHVIG